MSLELLGWSYFLCWSVSFWPQIVLNYTRKNTKGLSQDFINLNCIGFSCYAVYNLSLYLSPLVREQYRHRWGSDSNVALHDVVFSLHALAMCLITLFQTFIYSSDSKSSWSSKFAAICLILSLVVLDQVVLGTIEWIDLLYFLSSIKMLTTLVKYIPQVVLNYRFKSTAGWSITNIMLDFTGGNLSLLEILLTCIDTHDWTKITGNPIKFGLGLSSIVFDIIFMVQHFILYNRIPTHDEEYPSETSPLIDTTV